MLNRIGATLCIIVSSVNCAHGNIKSSSEHAVQQQSVRFNHAQFLGSHNSYKKAVHPTVLTLITSHNPKLSRQINYSHIDLDAQLDVGLRHLEIDVLVDDTGGKYAYPLAEKIAGSRLLDKAERQQLLKPGFKVLHIPDLDISSHCQLFSECLHQLTAWSNRNPEHLPISILLNVKESHIKFVKGTIPEEFGPAQYQALDRVIFNAISEQSLFSPDSLRAHYDSLDEAIEQAGWPLLKDMRGKFIFIFDANTKQRELYRDEHFALMGRAMFASYEPGEPEAAIMIRNNPVEQFSEISSLVDQGYLIRTRADADLSAPTAKNQARFQAAKASGAQVISTDYYPSSPQAIESGYQVSFSDDCFVQSNQRLQREHSSVVCFQSRIAQYTQY